MRRSNSSSRSVRAALHASAKVRDGCNHTARLQAVKALETTTDPDRKAELEKALLSKEQQAALAHIKRYTDFNDLATQSSLGQEGVKRQVKITVNKAIEEAQQKQQQRRQQAQRQRRTRRAAPI